jgi:hypothetical protein
MRFAADENFNGDVLEGLMPRMSRLDIVRVYQLTYMYADMGFPYHYLLLFECEQGTDSCRQQPLPLSSSMSGYAQADLLRDDTTNQLKIVVNDRVLYVQGAGDG